ncbi:indolepyruvate ferredoxin oxidoreductase family protein [Roseateles violae]|uniref:Indolepyruvate ferredoxin oxidoreductase family protein n=1 Tax=Roseateles violae TaxID=3058042 RepID=A0ABT8DXG4_9BURK|nr:indolepyruvate ferredoxin oxidoreductase family protein [Pelomonas sp. PFR6]MDN3921482.1 indolepyruvate ferredoxin oxidoreductase family protein [Pelomonas sp. PFR6]
MNAPLPLDSVTLEDKYRSREGWVYLTGIQALTRLPLQQRARDQAAGLNTGGFISGYRGSPLGRYDMELWSQASLLEASNIRFVPGVNEELAATAVCGSQYVGLLPGSQVDGVFGIWYGKGPGTDRSADALRHLASAGTSKFGGVLAIAGDDHGLRSSSIHNFSDPIFIAVGMPVLYPSNTQELLDLGLLGFAMSRYSGCAIGFKVHADVAEGGGSVLVSPAVPQPVLPPEPQDPTPGAEDRHIRIGEWPTAAEQRLHEQRLPAALRYARANRLNYIVDELPAARLGIISAGKSYQDLLQAFERLQWSSSQRAALGIRVAKLALVWPLDPQFIAEFAQGLDTIVVVEEKRGIVEEQLKALLCDLRLPATPRVIGKFWGANPYAADRGAAVLPGWGELNPELIARALTGIAKALIPDAALPEPAPALAAPLEPAPVRSPAFCSGCPHNRSTKLPEDSRGMVGIGCHAMVALSDKQTPPMFTQMGGEGMHWVGQAAFTNEQHVFANMGDGTYFHSGVLAIRQAIAAKVTMTYKILVNGFVSMTGGQPIDGELTVPQMVAELRAEGVQQLYVVSDDVAKYAPGSFPKDVPVLDRAQLDSVMQRCRATAGLSVIVYDQVCATARRRLRKKGRWADVPKRSFINAAVCEGCGDCGKASNCLSIEALETPLGRKRKINQSSCNKDFSCVEGFCPSFVTVHGGSLRKPVSGAASGASANWPEPPEPERRALEGQYSMLVTGIGGTGVVTIAQILGMAAHMDELACSILDVTGLAQKYGAVLSHVRLASTPDQLHAARIAAAEADTVVGCDLLVTASEEGVSRISARTRVFVASDLVQTSEFARNPDWSQDAEQLLQRIRQRGSPGQLQSVEALRLANGLMGDAIALNMIMLGYAWQSGAIPLSHASLMRAIELNGVSVEFNKTSFLWGRRAAVDLAAVRRAAAGEQAIAILPRRDASLDETLARFGKELRAYQNEAYARRYTDFVARAIEADRRLGRGERFGKAVARYYYKLLAYKDEFEVARLFSAPEFKRELEATFEGDYKLHFHIGAWPFSRKDAAGKPVKREFGPWLMPAFRVLAGLRFLRGSWMDPFRHGAERRLALEAIAEYEAQIASLLGTLSADNYELAVAIASAPEKIRGYGHVRERQLQLARQEVRGLLERLRAQA